MKTKSYFFDKNYQQIFDRDNFPYYVLTTDKNNFLNLVFYKDKNTFLEISEGKVYDKFKSMVEESSLADWNYLEILESILEKNNTKEDRTGVGTISIFGTQSRFDLQREFPLLTTKKVVLRNIISELIWFINGDTNRKYLHKHNNPIWDLWNRPYNLNRELKSHFIRFSDFDKNYEIINQQRRYKNNVLNGIFDEAKLNYQSKEDKLLFSLWKEYMENNKNLKEGSYISFKWQNYDTFIKEVKRIPHYNYFLENPKDFILAPMILGTVLSKDNSWFISKEEYKYYEEEGQYEENLSGIKYYRFEIIAEDDLGPIYGKQWRDFNGVDQLQQVITEIKKNPNSRRLIVSTWNPVDLPNMALYPCHTMFQFYVNNGELSCQLYQRSADFPIGTPFNIASYAILTHLVALECGLSVGEFIYTTGDTHIYTNQIEAIKRQLERFPNKGPKIKINNFKSLFEVKPEDIEIIDYNSHPFLRIPVSK